MIGSSTFGPTLGLYPFSGSKSAGPIGNLTGYSLTQVVTISYNVVGTASFLNLTTFNAALEVVPEPATLALLGVGLGAVVVARRRRAAKSA